MEVATSFLPYCDIPYILENQLSKKKDKWGLGSIHQSLI